ATRSLRRLEAEEDAELRRRYADLREVEDRAAKRGPERPTAEHRTLVVDQRCREVDLAHDPGDLSDGAPPVPRLPCRIRLAVDEQPRLTAEIVQPRQETQDVGSILRVRRRPGRGKTRAVELVLRDQGVGAVRR